MGTMYYGFGRRDIEIEDRTLMHLKVVIITKLRRGESFCMSWPHGVDKGSGRSSIWLHPSIPLEFSFAGNRPATPNRAWIEALLHSANGPDGLQILSEPAPVNH